MEFCFLFPGDPKDKTFHAAFSKWKGVAQQCHGMWKRDVCVFGIKDLPDLVVRKDLFCNKFYLDFQPLALDCLEAWIQQKTHCPTPLDVEFYQGLSFVKRAGERPNILWSMWRTLGTYTFRVERNYLLSMTW